MERERQELDSAPPHNRLAHQVTQLCSDWPVISRLEEHVTCVYLFHLLLQVSDSGLSAVLFDEETQGIR